MFSIVTRETVLHCTAVQAASCTTPGGTAYTLVYVNTPTAVEQCTAWPAAQ